MIVRRVVTGHDKNGKSVFVSDGPPPRSKQFEHTPGFASNLAWATPEIPPLPAGAKDPTLEVKSFVPTPSETRFIIVTFPPDSVYATPGFDFAASGKEAREQSPGLADLFEPDDPAMHTTPTVDCGVILDGEVWLELDDGKSVLLKRHDTFIQNGTRHAWRNKSEKPVTLAVVLIGAEKK